METDQIDELLERYEAARSRIAANLLELHDHPTYGLITDQALTGTSARRLADVGAAAPTLWSGLDALSDVLDEARAVRDNGRLGAERRARLTELLTGPSVLLDVEEVALADRGLLEPGRTEQRVTIETLLGRLRDSYEPLRDGIADIDAVWREVLPRLDAADTTLAELRQQLALLGTVEPAVDRLDRRVRDTRSMVMDDPLGLSPDAADDLDRAVADAARAVGQLRRGHDALDADLARTEVLVAEARSLLARAGTALAEAQAKVRDPGGLAAVPSTAVVEVLAERAAALRAERGPWLATRDRLDAWLNTAERLVEQLTVAVRRNRQPLDRRDQLRGLLSAYRAKAAAVGRIEDGEVADLIDEAHNELFTAPTDLGRASALVRDIGERVQPAAEVAP